jgi:hypothetical protein
MAKFRYVGLTRHENLINEEIRSALISSMLCNIQFTTLVHSSAAKRVKIKI